MHLTVGLYALAAGAGVIGPQVVSDLLVAVRPPSVTGVQRNPTILRLRHDCDIFSI